MKLSIKIPITLMTFCLISSLAAQKTERPGWLGQRPIDKAYYYGIGSALKVDHPVDYPMAAKNMALQDLASEIAVQIKSSITISTTENDSGISEEMTSYINAATRNNLEGYEMVDAWEDDAEYWVCYRLSRALYNNLRDQRKSNAMARAADLLVRARQKIAGGNVSSGLISGVQGLYEMEEFLGENVVMLIDDKPLNLVNELTALLEKTLSRIRLESLNPEIEGISGRMLKAPLRVRATVDSGQDSSRRVVPNLALGVRFIRGSGELPASSVTDSRGMAQVSPVKIVSNAHLQIIEVQPAALSVGKQKISPLLQKRLIALSLVAPRAKFTIRISGLLLAVEAQETNLGHQAGVFYVEPQLKNALADSGFSFTDNVSRADILVKITTASRKGAEIYNLYTAFADINLSLIDLSTGREIYKKSLNGIKGIQLDYEKAGLDALQKAGLKIKTLTPELSNLLKSRPTG